MRRISLLFLCCLLSTYTYTQSSSSQTRFSRFVKTSFKDLYSFPLSLNKDKKTMQHLAWIAPTLSASFILDHAPNFQAHPTPNKRSVLYYVADFYGNGIAPLGISGILLAKKNPRLAREVFRSALTARFYTQLFKYTFNRRRPHQTDKELNWHGPFHKQENVFNIFRLKQYDHHAVSFISGHASVAMAVSHTMALDSRRTIEKVAWYALAGLSSAMRIYAGEHWLSDVVAGNIIGYLSARFIRRKRVYRPDIVPSL